MTLWNLFHQNKSIIIIIIHSAKNEFVHHPKFPVPH